MNTNKWLLLGALAGLTALAITRQRRLRRQQLFEPLSDYSKQEARARASIDDVPTLQQAAAGEIEKFDASIAPAAPL